MDSSSTHVCISDVHEAEHTYFAFLVIASTAGLKPVLIPVYGAAKHAIVGVSRSLAFAQEKWGIRVNALCPSFVRTDFMMFVGCVLLV